MKFYFIILTLVSGSLFSQKENNTWYFGKNRGLDFNTPGGNPSLLTNNTMNTWEGCAAISENCTGELLFYTNGIKVWDKNHNQMPNGVGLMGGISASGLQPSSAAQSSIIVPKPGNKNIYYIFTNDCSENANAAGFRYSIVDMTLNGGLGDVTLKNVLLFAPGTEKVSAVHHSNKRDIWVVSHGKNDNRFYSYLVTPNGVSAPVITQTGSTVNWNIGYLRFSPNGKWLVCCAFTQMTNPTSPTFAELFQFNYTTGIMSNPIYFDGPYYGAEFSPNSSILYLAYGKKLEQYDLSAGSAANIIASKYSLGAQGDNWWAIQQGPNKKIYGTIGQNSLHVINNPNVMGAGANLQRKAINLNGSCNMGLTNFVVSYFDSSMYIPRNGLPFATINAMGKCVNYPVTFTFASSTPVSVDSIRWSFGEPSSGTLNFSTQENPSHSYSGTGTFYVSMVRFTSCGNDTTFDTLQIAPQPVVNINDSTLCYGEPFMLQSNISASSYLWHDGSNLSFFKPYTSGLCWIEATHECGISRDSAYIEFEDCEATLFVPNAFIPGSVGINNSFFAKGINIAEFNLKIFNRWGQKLFESNDINLGWDGTYGGNICQQDVYVWKITYVDFVSSKNHTSANENIKQRVGHVTLLR